MKLRKLVTYDLLVRGKGWKKGVKVVEMDTMIREYTIQEKGGGKFDVLEDNILKYNELK